MGFFSEIFRQKMVNTYYVTLCSIIKDENDYIDEWIKYHLGIGVKHFYLYDNGSKVPVAKKINDLGLKEFVTVVSIPGKAKQVKAYNHCLANFGRNCNWIGFIDIDEFIVPIETDGNLEQFLRQFEPYGGIGINWLVFGSNGHQHKPLESQLESFTMRAEKDFHIHKHVKCIVQPQFTKSAGNAHYFNFQPGYFCVNEHYNIVNDSFSEISVDRIWINHYYCRSKQEYEEKVVRGLADTTRRSRSMQEFYNHDKDANRVFDNTIIKIANKRRNNLN